MELFRIIKIYSLTLPSPSGRGNQFIVIPLPLGEDRVRVYFYRKTFIFFFVIVAFMKNRSKPILKIRAQELRKNSTYEERLLWSHIRNSQLLGLKFRRQEPIGDYIVDFACIEKKMIIELDGGHHNQEENKEYDNNRTDYLNACGWRVLRFWNNEVKGNLKGVLEMIRIECIKD
jgi:very-short-patch-repair endonuclease